MGFRAQGLGLVGFRVYYLRFSVYRFRELSELSKFSGPFSPIRKPHVDTHGRMLRLCAAPAGAAVPAIYPAASHLEGRHVGSFGQRAR